MQVTWLLLYIGGEPLLDRLLCYVKKNLLKSPALTNEAKSVLLKCINFFLEEKSYFKSVHNALFYINGSYYNISNRVIGIHYVSNFNFKTIFICFLIFVDLIEAVATT